MVDKPGFADAAATWDRRYSGDALLFGSAPNAYLASQVALLHPGQTALAVADGEGRNSIWLAQHGVQVDAFDISAVGVAKAAQRARAAGVVVNLEVADCDHWRWPNAAYDVVVAIFVQFADPALRERLFARMIGALKPGGHLIVQGYTPRQLELGSGGPGIRSHLYTADMLRQLCAALEMVELRDYEATLDEGSGHCGRSALLGMVARKAPDRV